MLKKLLLFVTSLFFIAQVNALEIESKVPVDCKKSESLNQDIVYISKADAKQIDNKLLKLNLYWSKGTCEDFFKNRLKAPKRFYAVYFTGSNNQELQSASISSKRIEKNNLIHTTVTFNLNETSTNSFYNLIISVGLKSYGGYLFLNKIGDKFEVIY